jgi:hypothetical protein|tara:strand:+ start:373 stop:480 length:108 start_codon:yes stop_codon:yes gene_type:complete
MVAWLARVAALRGRFDRQSTLFHRRVFRKKRFDAQ